MKPLLKTTVLAGALLLVPVWAQTHTTTTVYITTQSTYFYTVYGQCNALPFCDAVTWAPLSVSTSPATNTAASSSGIDTSSSSTGTAPIPSVTTFYIQTDGDGEDLFFQFDNRGQVVIAPATITVGNTRRQTDAPMPKRQDGGDINDLGLVLPLLQLNEKGLMRDAGDPKKIVLLRPDDSLYGPGDRSIEERANPKYGRVLYRSPAAIEADDIVRQFNIQGKTVFLVSPAGVKYEYYRVLQTNYTFTLYNLYMAAVGASVPSDWEKVTLVTDGNNAPPIPTVISGSSTSSSSSLSTSFSSMNTITSGSSTSSASSSTSSGLSDDVTAAYEVILSNSLQPYCSTLLQYSTFSTPTILSAQTTVSTSVSTDLFIISETSVLTESEYLDTVTVPSYTSTETSTATTVLSTLINRRAEKRQIPDPLTTFVAAAISSGCMLAVTSPVPTTEVQISTVTSIIGRVETSSSTDVTSSVSTLSIPETQTFSGPPVIYTNYIGYPLSADFYTREYRTYVGSDPANGVTEMTSSVTGVLEMLVYDATADAWRITIYDPEEPDPFWLTVKQAGQSTTLADDTLTFRRQSVIDVPGPTFAYVYWDLDVANMTIALSGNNDINEGRVDLISCITIAPQYYLAYSPEGRPLGSCFEAGATNGQYWLQYVANTDVPYGQEYKRRRYQPSEPLSLAQPV
ncbi:hypothetical protein TWF696_005408 [Orbilia brochopaga]|uniref:Uncharacterized protein n=1 Tax=Orbilia brochopaga TaxID=3140254 RepID=A0AAV9V1N4_9PEZI